MSRPKGKPLSEEHKKRISISATGRKHTAATKQKIRETASGKKFTPDHVQKLTESLNRPEVKAKVTATRIANDFYEYVTPDGTFLSKRLVCEHYDILVGCVAHRLRSANYSQWYKQLK